MRLAVALALITAAVAAPATASNPWARLHRPLHIPRLALGASCPVSPVQEVTPLLGLGQGRGPVFPVQWAGHVPIAHNSEWGPVWGGNEVMWAAPKAYRGPVLIRGRQLDGPNLVRFGDGPAPVDELRLMLATAQTVPAWSGRLWDTYTRLAAPGCYGWQVDGTSFSRVIVFSATLTS